MRSVSSNFSYIAAGRPYLLALLVNVLFVRHVPGVPGVFMVILIIPSWRRDYLCHFKILAHTLSVLKDFHLNRFINIIPDIINVFIKYVIMLILH